ncbi:MAG: hypothetical protein QMD09_13515 [Desulfatibacillaceae bacterium]|nr:hypothetical protein [Desulfatibacillaceae bacterium]
MTGWGFGRLGCQATPGCFGHYNPAHHICSGHCGVRIACCVETQKDELVEYLEDMLELSSHKSVEQ